MGFAPWGSDADVQPATSSKANEPLWQTSPYAMGGEMAGGVDPLGVPRNQAEVISAGDSLSAFMHAREEAQRCSNRVRSNAAAEAIFPPSASMHRGKTRCASRSRHAVARREEAADEAWFGSGLADEAIIEYHHSQAQCGKTRAHATKVRNPIAGPAPRAAELGGAAVPFCARASPMWTAAGGGDALAAARAAAAAESAAAAAAAPLPEFGMMGGLKTSERLALSKNASALGLSGASGALAQSAAAEAAAQKAAYARNAQFRFAEKARSISLVDLRRDATASFDPARPPPAPDASTRADAFRAGRDEYARRVDANRGVAEAKAAIFGGC